ncbi:hypothetical protein [Streptomyces sp. NPDC054838]
MPRPDLNAVRSAANLTEKQSHLIVTFAALGDVARRRPRWQWTHISLASQLGVSSTFVDLLQGYLEFRTVLPQLSPERGIRLHPKHGAQLYRIAGDVPLDLVSLGGSKDPEVLLAALFKEAVYRKVRIDGKTVFDVERLLGRACNRSWEDITAVFQRQRTAQDIEREAA